MTKDRAQHQVAEQRDDLQLLNQVMRHDIRNDLQLVQAYAELLDEHVDDDGEEYLEKIKESAESAVGMTTTARDLAQVILRSGEETYPVGVARLLRRQVEDVVSAYPEAIVRINGTLPETEVVANDMLGSVFRNLLRNAIEHNDTSPPEVIVSGALADDTVRITVADNGPGVANDQKQQIFAQGKKGSRAAVPASGSIWSSHLLTSTAERSGSRITTPLERFFTLSYGRTNCRFGSVSE